MTEAKHDAIRAYYHTLFSAWGRQHWWPAQSRFEVIVGAYLTQNTAWTNVEKALGNLRKARLSDGQRNPAHAAGELEQLIRPSGYFRQKAQRLKTFVRFLDERYGGSLARMFARPTAELRDELLALNGVGPETADSILLYAGNHPVFVVDAYTRRILERHGIVWSAAAMRRFDCCSSRRWRSSCAGGAHEQEFSSALTPSAVRSFARAVGGPRARVIGLRA
jgi:endonuclease III related protein